MSQVIKPTNGRIVWFTPGGDFTGSWHDIQQPLPAMVCHVWGDRMVNLLVTDSNGITWPVTSVDLVQPGDPKVYQARYCEWMPFQKGQAAKTEAAEATIAKGAGGSAPDKWCSNKELSCTYPNCTCHTTGGSACPGGLT